MNAKLKKSIEDIKFEIENRQRQRQNRPDARIDANDMLATKALIAFINDILRMRDRKDDKAHVIKEIQGQLKQRDTLEKKLDYIKSPEFKASAKDAFGSDKAAIKASDYLSAALKNGGRLSAELLLSAQLSKTPDAERVKDTLRQTQSARKMVMRSV
jgi:hypothetical protein